MSYLTTRESLIGHSGWAGALSHYTEMDHSSSSFLGTASNGRGSNPRPSVPMALNIPEGHRGISPYRKKAITFYFVKPVVILRKYKVKLQKQNKIT